MAGWLVGWLARLVGLLVSQLARWQVGLMLVDSATFRKLLTFHNALILKLSGSSINSKIIICVSINLVTY